jgi:mannose-1-phosphate guanylyltransferase
MKVLLLCAGRGTRLKPLTDKTPKCLIKVNGIPIIGHILDNFSKGFDVVEPFVNLNYLPLEIVKELKHYVTYIAEPKLLGTAGTIREFGKYLDDNENFFVVNGDTITNVSVANMEYIHKKKKLIATIFTKDNEVHCGGTYIFNRKILDYIPQVKPYSIHEDLIPKLLKKKIPITLYKSDAYYFSIDTPQKLAKARKFFK